MSKTLIRIVPLLVIVAGMACAGILVFLKPSADKSEVSETAVLVQVMEAMPTEAPVQVHTTGIVLADQEVTLSPEVSGRVTSVSQELLPGGRVNKGDVLLRIDSRSYQAVVTQREAEVTRAELDLTLEQGRQVIAQREWDLLGSEQEGANTDIALRKPQLANTLAQLESARAGLRHAQLDLERTAMRAPFNAVVVSESADIGQVVSSASQVVTLVGTDRARVEVQIPVENLPNIDIPDSDSATKSIATITQSLGHGQSVVREAAVHRLVGRLDGETRTATLLLLVNDPQGDGELPLLPGAYVSVAINGKSMAQAVRVPRSAVYEGETIWLADGDSRLARRSVEIGFRTPDQVYVTGGLAPGERVVTSALSMPLEGTMVRIDAPAKQGETQPVPADVGEEG